MHADQATEEAAGPPSVWVTFPGLRLEDLRTTQRWDDALLRELQLMAADDGVDLDRDELREDLADVRAAIGQLRPLLEEALAAALGSGRAADEVVLVATPDLLTLAEQADAAFRRVDERCGGVMLLARPPALARGFREWFLGQFREQAAGRPAVAWREWWSLYGDGSALPDEMPSSG